MNYLPILFLGELYLSEAPMAQGYSWQQVEAWDGHTASLPCVSPATLLLVTTSEVSAIFLKGKGSQGVGVTA